MATAKKKAKKTVKASSLSASQPVHCGYVETPEDKKRREEYRIEDDARTLMQAQEIREDKGRLAKAKAWAKKRSQEILSITSITD